MPLLLLLALSWAIPCHAEFSAENEIIITEIEFVGLQRTAEKVVQQELLFEAGTEVRQATINESMQRLRNLRIFSRVEPSLSQIDNKQAKLTTQLQEKWTSVPILRGSSGGGANYLVVGAYDINIFGKYKEVGGQYENYNGEHSGVIWYRNPRFFGQRLLFGLDLWRVARPYVEYDNNAGVQQRFVLNRQKLNTFLHWETHPLLTLGVGFEYNNDHLLDSDTAAKYYRSHANLARLFLALGRINYDNYLLNGYRTELALEKTIGIKSIDEHFTRGLLTSQFFLRLPWYSNLAFHFRTGGTNTKAQQHLFYLGGLENIRGYFDTRFQANSFWQLNLEYRIPSVRSDTFVLQNTFFIDVVQVAATFSKLLDERIYSSVGTGIRLISPRIYRLTIRLDIAFPSHSGDTSTVSMGAQQFF